MGKPFDLSVMPPLTVEFHEEMRYLETRFSRAIATCITGYKLHDQVGVFDYTRTYAVEFYDQIYGFYSQYPECRKRWKLACEYYSFQRIVHCLDNYSVIRDFFMQQDRLDKIIQTISDHARAKSRAAAMMPIYKTVLDAPKYPPVFANTTADNPLLTMAKSIKFLDPVVSRRKSFVQPLLDEKGWSLAQWAEEAKVSRHTAKSYVEGKRKTYHSNMKQLAEALGVSFQKFPK
jgi:lambda repressor-like predicted transcriptional regulator